MSTGRPLPPVVLEPNPGYLVWCAGRWGGALGLAGREVLANEHSAVPMNTKTSQGHSTVRMSREP